MKRDLTVVMIVPTGIGARIGGHSGDATVAAQLLSGACGRLILHPNVVNASDMNEMPNNALYVEGSALDAFLAGEIRLREVRRNRILVVCNEAGPHTVNAVNAARSVLGIEAEVLELPEPLVMRGWIGESGAAGSIEGVESLLSAVQDPLVDFDALAIHTPIEVEPAVSDHYIEHGGVNPWGGVEAELSRRVGSAIRKPCAHAPFESTLPTKIVAPRVAPEYIGVHLVSVLKGLSRAPRWASVGEPDTLSIGDVDALVSPMCWGVPHDLCAARGIPVLLVEENTTIKQVPADRGERVASYYEAVGWLTALQLGVAPLWRR